MVGSPLLNNSFQRLSEPKRVFTDRIEPAFDHPSQVPACAYLAVESFSRVAGFTAGGRTLVAVTTKTVCVWTPESGARQEFPLNPDLPQSFSGQFGKPYDVSRDQPLIVRGGLNGVVEVWGLTAETRLGEWHAHVGAISTQAANEVRLWDVASAKRVAALKGHLQGSSALAFSADGRTLATASGDRRIKLWNLATYQEVASFAMGGPLPTLSFSPDGRILAIGELPDTGRGIHVLLAPSFEEVTAREARGDARGAESSVALLHSCRRAGGACDANWWAEVGGGIPAYFPQSECASAKWMAKRNQHQHTGPAIEYPNSGNRILDSPPRLNAGKAHRHENRSPS